MGPMLKAHKQHLYAPCIIIINRVTDYFYDAFKKNIIIMIVLYDCVKESSNCKMRMPGKVKCRPTVAY